MISMAELVQYYGTGRRKSAIARVYLRPGSGEFKVNGRPFEQYFVTPAQRSAAKQPLLSTDTAAGFNVIARVSGGGVNGQAGAVTGMAIWSSRKACERCRPNEEVDWLTSP